MVRAVRCLVGSGDLGPIVTLNGVYLNGFGDLRRGGILSQYGKTLCCYVTSCSKLLSFLF